MRTALHPRFVAFTLGALVLAFGSAATLVSHRRTAREGAPTVAANAARVGSDRARTDPMTPMAASSDDRLQRAAALHARAESLQAAGRAGQAAALHRASAALRPADDPLATRCLENAGILLSSTGDFGDARVVMRAAAAHAMARGDIAGAAELTLLAGFIARDQGDSAGMAEQAREARWLASAPSVTRARRAAILSRIGYAGATR